MSRTQQQPQQIAQIYTQDPTVGKIEKIALEGVVSEGPSDAYVVAPRDRYFTRYSDRETGDFIFDPARSRAQFDQVSTFVVINQVRGMYTRALNRIKPQGGAWLAGWQWGAAPIIYEIRAGDDPNAYYSRDERVLAFFSFYSPQAGKRIYTSQSFDVVAHEAGHAILDTLKPGLFDSWHPQAGALHEAFGDLTAIFAAISIPSLRHSLLLDTRGDLTQDSFLNKLAEQFGAAILPSQNALRNANHVVKLGEVSDEVHDLSVVLTGAVYEVLIQITNHELAKNGGTQEPEVTLLLTSQQVLDLFLKAILSAPVKDVIFADIASWMIRLSDDPTHKTIIRQAFERRNVPLIFNADALDKAAGLPPEKMMSEKNIDHRTCCGTLHKEIGKSMIKAADKKRARLAATVAEPVTSPVLPQSPPAITSSYAGSSLSLSPITTPTSSMTLSERQVEITPQDIERGLTEIVTTYSVTKKYTVPKLRAVP